MPIFFVFMRRDAILFVQSLGLLWLLVRHQARRNVEEGISYIYRASCYATCVDGDRGETIELRAGDPALLTSKDENLFLMLRIKVVPEVYDLLFA